MADTKTQRVRDPIHDLIIFHEGNEVDQLAWRLINTREFQRLRRIRQLGFSDFVYPCATHTRFSHCIGVFHTARQILGIVQREIGQRRFNRGRAKITAIAALLHDVGHGPFSHTFEQVEKGLGFGISHEKRTADIILGDTEIRHVLNDVDATLADEVATLLLQKDPVDIYSSVVSSQFDADRLDYLRRDRFMTGTGMGGIDFSWLLDGLRVGRITIRPPGEEDFIEVDGFYLNSKSMRTAEEYLLARFNLYLQVYMHKTTRAAEQMLQATLSRFSELLDEGNIESTGLSSENRLTRYFSGDRGLESYLMLDDAGVWAGLNGMASSDDAALQYLANALLNRRLYKCFDAGEYASKMRGDSLQRFLKELQDAEELLRFENGLIPLHDEANVTLYGVHGFDESGALQKVLIEPSRGERPQDIGETSQILGSVGEHKLYRVYTPDDESRIRITQLWEEAN